MLKKLIAPTVTFLPMLALAAGSSSNASLSYFEQILESVYKILQQLTIIFIGVAVVAFLYGLMRYVWTDDSKKRDELRGYLFTGIIILFVMTTLWGIVYWIREVLGIDAADAGSGPGLPTP
jgi:hypothetical protein